VKSQILTGFTKYTQTIQSKTLIIHTLKKQPLLTTFIANKGLKSLISKVVTKNDSSQLMECFSPLDRSKYYLIHNESFSAPLLSFLMIRY